MHARTFAGLSLAVLACAAAPTARAADGPPETGTTTYTNRDLGATRSTSAAPLYTNADLEKFGPPERATAPRRETARMDESEAWAFVQAALDREATRLEDERRHALELEAARAMGAAEGHDGCGGGGYITAPFVGFGFGNPRFRDRRIPFPDPHAKGPFLPRPGSRDTIHGRPPATQTQHGRYSRLRGADAVPRGYFLGSPASRGGHGGTGGGHGRGPSGKR